VPEDGACSHSEPGPLKDVQHGSPADRTAQVIPAPVRMSDVADLRISCGKVRRCISQAASLTGRVNSHIDNQDTEKLLR
jgi:hypothetical protein